MELPGVTWVGPPADDGEILAELPRELRSVLSAINGFVLFGGALHVRGAVREPAWHSLRNQWSGPDALADLYPAIQTNDIPFAQDCVGDQFLLRDGEVVRLVAETGEVEPLGMLLHAYPPFCSEQAAAGVSLRPVPAAELIRFHADVARQMASLPEGASFELRMVD